MTNPKMKDCPNCGTDDFLAVYTYEAGNRHVECNGCWSLGPAGTSIRQAIKLYNERVEMPAPLGASVNVVTYDDNGDLRITRVNR